MKAWLPAAALAATLTLGFPADAHMGGVGGASASAVASSRASAGLRGIGFGFHHRFLAPTHLFHSPHLRFGAGFVSHRFEQVTGGYGDYDYGADADDYGPYDDDIDNLHFRAQEPFGPGDIGRPPAEEDAPYVSERMGSWRGYQPQD
jgi:hypothetical protein